MEERKGVLTSAQEKTLDKLVVSKNSAIERVDGIAIALVDNQIIERLKGRLEEKHPGALNDYVYPIIDALFEGLDKLIEEE